ncbi:MAG: biotin/lipoyl-binding protein [Ruminiclostridium sp.]|nr:biotin/lipoyl-binding protein [Ruminiclostridium sp.]
MKKYLITVNGNQYEVEVEEVKDNSVSAPAGQTEPALRAAAPVAAAAPAPVPTLKPAAAGNAVPAGAATITAPMPGTILKVNVNAGDSVKKGQVLLILEAMKMENEIVAAADGKISSVNVAKGSSVNAGDVLVSLT